jgi:NAD(P)-dependent dehydrogenase (short-subunit alcohol dehydrogenase family)
MHAVVTGANRGIGLAIASTLLNDYDATVALAVRNPELVPDNGAAVGSHPGKSLVIALDYTDHASIIKAARSCHAAFDHIDLLVNCAAVNKAPGWRPEASKGNLKDLHPEALAGMLSINVIGPVMTCQAFLPLLLRSKRPCVVNVSTSRASLGSVEDPGSFGYAISKAALNMATRKIASELANSGGAAVAIDPGWVRTRMGGPEAPVEPADAAARLLAVAIRNDDAVNSRFLNLDGEDVPW